MLGDSDVDGKLAHPAFGLDFILNGTAGDRNSNASTTGKAELDDPPFIIGLRPLLLALVARCIPSSGCKHGLHKLIRLIEFSRYDDSEAFWLPAIFAAIFLLGGFLLLRRPHATPAVPVILA
jgi:hypothetical protein